MGKDLTEITYGFLMKINDKGAKMNRIDCVCCGDKVGEGKLNQIVFCEQCLHESHSHVTKGAKSQ